MGNTLASPINVAAARPEFTPHVVQRIFQAAAGKLTSTAGVLDMAAAIMGRLVDQGLAEGNCQGFDDDYLWQARPPLTCARATCAKACALR